LPEVGDDAYANGAVDAQQALSELRSLLAEFSGDSLDYFESVRSGLSALLPTAAMERLANHMQQYEFEAAARLLATAAQNQEKP